MNLSKNELIYVTGGGISSSMINSITKLITTLMDLGRAIGSALRYAKSGKKCS